MKRDRMIRVLRDQWCVARKELAENVVSGFDPMLALHIEHSTEHYPTFLRICVTINIFFNVMKDADYERWLLEAGGERALLETNYSVGVGCYIDTPILCASDPLVAGVLATFTKVVDLKKQSGIDRFDRGSNNLLRGWRIEPLHAEVRREIEDRVVQDLVPIAEP